MYSIDTAIVFLFLLINVFQNRLLVSADSPTPVVLWHGMGDSCCFSFSLGQIKNILEEQIPGIYVHSIKIGNNEVEDVINGYFSNVHEQLDQVCFQMQNDSRLDNGYNAIGFSQGGQFLRALAQRCPNPPMKTLISLGGQHQGIYGLPHCGTLENRMCDYIRRLLNYSAYSKFVQEKLVQAQYWHDPLKEDEYKKYSIFLADINNEGSVNQPYIDNLQRLQKLVLVKFENDSMVVPPESEWFGFYKPGQAVEIQTLQESTLYKEDRLGLREMDEAGKIDFISVAADHLQFTAPWFIDNIIRQYL